MQQLADEIRVSGKTIGFVPTMGALHEGHISLIEEAKKHANFIVISIFINPTQFNQKRDLEEYPHNFETDEKLAKTHGVHCVFYPTTDEMYPQNTITSVAVSEITDTLCGGARGEHFEGVALVVTKLFNIMKPHVVIFGQKDAQQAAMVRRIISDLNFDVKFLLAPTVRESNGLARSSRNLFLSEKDRISASAMYRGLSVAKKAFINGERNAEKLLEIARKIIETTHLKIDYLECVDFETFQIVNKIEKSVFIAVAVFLGDVRLIDNEILEISYFL
jgi:pantoate--beta-alanine ligase